MSQHTPIVDRPPLTLATKLLYASGSVGTGIKKSGLATFVMIFYNQVLGVPAEIVGLALGIALVVDAFVDPIIGQVSDNFHSRWGRRHPFMYASILPVSLGFMALWMAPSGWSHQSLFIYLLAFVLMVRIFDTFFEMPAAGLMAELTDGYDQRTALVSLRYIFGTLGALLMKIAAYRIFLQPDDNDAAGILNREGYAHYGITAAVVICVAFLAATLGTHHRIPFLHRPRKRRITFVAMAREIVATLNNRSWMALMASGVFVAIAKGAASGIGLYFAAYFWGLRSHQISLLVVADLVASLLGAFVSTWVGARLGKKRAAIVAFVCAVLSSIGPMTLRLVDLMPPNHSDSLFYILFGATLVHEFAGMLAAVLLSSMAVDLVEDSQIKTGRRSEGLLFAADNLLQKAVAGIGVFFSGFMLMLVNFPAKARPGSVAPEILQALGLAYVLVIAPVYLAAIFCLFAYRIDRAAHERNLKTLQQQA